MKNYLNFALSRLFAFWTGLDGEREMRIICKLDRWRVLLARPVLLLLLLTWTVVDAQRPPPITRNFDCRPNKCCDQHEWCRFWASIGECQSNGEWMTPNCQLACSTCPAAVEPTLPPKQPQQQQQQQQPQQQQQQQQQKTNEQEQQPVSQQQPQKGATLVGPPRCRQILEDSLLSSNVSLLARSENLILAAEDTRFRKVLSLSEITSSNRQFGCVPTVVPPDCAPNMCYHMLYRSLDGTCNNFQNPVAGAAFTRYRRLLPPEYDNGVGAPVSSIRQVRPSAREACRFLLSSSQHVAAPKYNGIMMQWGQFLAHDLLKTTLLPGDQCKTCADVPGRCFNIRTDPADPRFGQFGCLRMARSSPVCGTDTENKPREQLNENTAFIDGSMVYGSSVPDMLKLRDGRTGFMRMSSFNGRTYNPFPSQNCHDASNCRANFQTGDSRATLFLGLSAMHTVFVREHNRVARALQQVNPQWSGDRLFQEARKIVGAELQVITFNEWLPKILGESYASVIGNYSGYDSSIDPSIANEFVSASFRFGHGMIQEIYQRINAQGQPAGGGNMRFEDAVLKPHKLLFEGGVDPILRGMVTTAVKRPQRLTTAVTERMFGSTDLAATNIQRGRDHGVPSYNRWREFCGLNRAATMEDLKNQILDPAVRQNLVRGYTSPDNIDLYSGAMLEDPIINGLVGPTLACLLGEQFTRIRDGDRLWYENDGVFTNDQVSELRKSGLARVLCDNGDDWGLTPPDAMLLATKDNLTPCAALPAIDFSKWKAP